MLSKHPSGMYVGRVGSVPVKATPADGGFELYLYSQGSWQFDGWFEDIEAVVSYCSLF